MDKAKFWVHKSEFLWLTRETILEVGFEVAVGR